MNLDIVKVKSLKHTLKIFKYFLKNLDGETFIIVPDKLSLFMERFLFESTDMEASFDIQVMTMNRFCKSLLNDLNVEYKTISRIGSIMLTSKSIDETKPEYLSQYSSFSYASEIFNTISQIKSSNIEYNNLTNLNLSKNLSNKVKDLSKIYACYENKKAGYIDSSDIINLACMNMCNAKLINSNFMFLGFDDYTSLGYTFFENILRNSKKVISFNYSNYSEPNSSIFPNEVILKLKSICESLGCPYNEILSNYEDDKLHSFLTDNLFAYKNSSLNLNNCPIRLVNSSDSINELEFVARDIRRKILNGYQYKDFTIATYDFDSLRYEHILSKYEINYYLDKSVKLKEISLYKFLISFLKLFNENFSNIELINFISFEFVNIDNKQKINLINRIRKYNYRGNFNSDLFDEESAKLLKNLFDKCKILKTDTILEIENKVVLIFDLLNIDKKITQISEKISNFRLKKAFIQSKSQIFEIFSQIEQFYADANLEKVISILEESGDLIEINPLPLTLDAVQIVDAGEILSINPNLYIIGCNSSNSPVVLQDCGIILDNEILNINSNKFSLGPTVRHINRINKFKLFNSMLTFDNSLTITMSIKNPSEKSVLVKELEDRILVSGKNLKIDRDREIDNRNEILSNSDLIDYSLKFNEPCKLLDDLTCNINNLNSLSVNEINKIDFVSASFLESYFSCPRKFFYERILKLKQREEYNIESREIGDIIHKLAKAYYQDKDKITDINIYATQKTLQFISQNLKLKIQKDESILKLLLKEAQRFLNALEYMDKYSTFVPKYFEYGFGNFESSENFLGDKKLLGFVDRIDFCDFGFRIIDYKTGSVDVSLKELYYGLKLQLFLYADAIRNIFNKKALGSFYFPIKNEFGSEIKNPYRLDGYFVNEENNIRAMDTRLNTSDYTKSDIVKINLKRTEFSASLNSDSPLSSSEFDDLMKYAKDVSKKAVSEIFSGYIAPNPVNANKLVCSYCPYLELCRMKSYNVESRNISSKQIDDFKGDSNE